MGVEAVWFVDGMRVCAAAGADVEVGARVGGAVVGGRVGVGGTGMGGFGVGGFGGYLVGAGKGRRE